jgi:vitamin B12 transporter
MVQEFTDTIWNRPVPKCLFICILFCVYLIPCFAQGQDSTFLLRELEIYSSRYGIKVKNSGKGISIIEAEKMERMPVSSVDEILRYVPTLEVQSRGAFGIQSDISIRGGTFNQVLIMIDGMRLNDPLTGHFNSNIPVSMAEIERIEVIRGPAAAIYGPDAVGGVVNIITKSFSTEELQDQITGRVSGMYGGNNLRQTNSGLFVKKGKIKTGTGFMMNASDGHRLTPDSLRGDFDLKTWSLYLGADPTDKLQFIVRTALDNRSFNARYFYTLSPYDLSREQVKRWWNQAQVRYQVNSKQKTEFQIGYSVTRDQYLFNPAFPSNNHRTKFCNFQWNHHIDFKSTLRITGGIQADQKLIMSNDRGNHRSWHTGIFITGHYSLPGKLSVISGLRMDYDPSYHLEILPQVNLAYNRQKLTIRGSAGRTIRSPDFTERFISTYPEGPLSPGRNIGNPYLDAEKAWSVETGIDYHWSSFLQFHSTIFGRYSKDLIDYVLTNESRIPDSHNLIQGEDYYYCRNIARLHTYGWESVIESSLGAGSRMRIDWDLAYILLHSDSDSAIVSKYLVNHAKSLINGNLALAWTRLRINLNTLWKYRDREEMKIINTVIEPFYMVWNGKLDFLFRNHSFVCTLQINNLLNREYYDIPGAKMPGRWIMGEVTWNINKAVN